MHRRGLTTRRTRAVVGLAVAGLLFVGLFTAMPVAAAPPIPMRTEGRAFAAPGLPLPNGTPMRTFVDGVDYTVGAPQVQDAAGSFVVETQGNSKTNPDVSDTPDELEGPNLGDTVTYAAGDFTTFTEVFAEVEFWSPAGMVVRDLTLGSTASTPEPLKIQGLVPQPARGGFQFLFLCNPTSSAIGLSDYYLERNALGTYHGDRIDLTGSVPAEATVRVNLTSDSWLAVAGDALKLVYRNPRGANPTAEGSDIVVDRVEFNAVRNGTLNWEPGNTILGDAVAPGPGQILQRSACVDTNDPADFSLATEPGLPSTNGPPTVTITVPTSRQAVPGGAAVTFEWTLSDDVFHEKYLHVWANLTYGNQTVRLVSDGLGTKKATWMAPDADLRSIVLRVEVLDPFGPRGVATETYSVTRQSPLGLIIAIVIALVLSAFLLFAWLRARRKELGPPPQPPPSMPPTMPPVPPTVPATPRQSVPPQDSKSCPRCHTIVKVEDATCFFCGYRFPEDMPPLP